MNKKIEYLKLIISFIAVIIAASLPFYGFYRLWEFCMTQIPLESWTGMAKVCITIALVVVGGGVTIWASAMALFIVGSICLIIFGK